jgi:hypothetical protein
MDNLYTTTQAGDQLGISASRVRQLVLDFRRAGQEIGIKRGRDLFFTKDDIEALRRRPNQRPARRGKRKRPRSEE